MRNPLPYRLLTVTVALAMAVVAAGIVLVASHALDPNQVDLGSDTLGGWLTGLAESADSTRWGLGAGAAVVGLLSLVVLLGTLSGQRRRGAALHVLDSDDHGFVVVDSRGIAIVAEEAAIGAQGVVAAEVDVAPRSTRQVKLRVDVDVYPGANVKKAGQEARDRVRDAVETMVGIEVSTITTSTHVLEPEEMARALL